MAWRPFGGTRKEHQPAASGVSPAVPAPGQSDSELGIFQSHSSHWLFEPPVHLLLIKPTHKEQKDQHLQNEATPARPVLKRFVINST
jgi:hypothetical protein